MVRLNEENRAYWDELHQLIEQVYRLEDKAVDLGLLEARRQLIQVGVHLIAACNSVPLLFQAQNKEKNAADWQSSKHHRP